jgi:hypothetical protein
MRNTSGSLTAEGAEDAEGSEGYREDRNEEYGTCGG